MTTITDDDAFRTHFRNVQLAISASLEVLGQIAKEMLERSYYEMLKEVIDRVLAADKQRTFSDEELSRAIVEYAEHGRLPAPGAPPAARRATGKQRKQRLARNKYQREWQRANKVKLAAAMEARKVVRQGKRASIH
jgi:hypothetical protein